MTQQTWNHGPVPAGGTPPMNQKPDSGRKGLIIAIAVVSVLVLALGGFITYKLLADDKKTETASESTTAEAADGKLAAADVPSGDTLKVAMATADNEDLEKDVATGKPSDAKVLGFEEGVKSVQFGFEAGYGYTYHFDRDGQLTAVDYFDHGNEGTLTMLNGKGLKFDGEDFGFGDDEDEQPQSESFHNVIEYRQQGDKTEVYMSVNGKPAEKIATYYVDDQGRIIRTQDSSQTYRFTYNEEGRAFNQEGAEMYPPLILFFSEAPTLPKKHKVREKDAKGRPIQVDAYQDMQHYTITYWQ